MHLVCCHGHSIYSGRLRSLLKPPLLCLSFSVKYLAVTSSDVRAMLNLCAFGMPHVPAMHGYMSDSEQERGKWGICHSHQKE
jgi:hypothetical protein